MSHLNIARALVAVVQSIKKISAFVSGTNKYNLIKTIRKFSVFHLEESEENSNSNSGKIV